MKKPKDRLHRVLVAGATPAGVAAVNKLGELGIPVTLVDTDRDLDRKFSRDEWRLPSGIRLNYAHRPGLIRILRNPNIRVLMHADVMSIKHSTQGFSVRVVRRPVYIDPEKCIMCGRCADACPVTAPDGEKAVSTEGRGSLPGAPVIDKRREPLCQANCPLGVNVQGYMALTRAGKFNEALDLIRERNVLPGICGRICTRPCESACRRGEMDDPLAIRDIKRFLADLETDGVTAAGYSGVSMTHPIQDRKKVAVIGSGPAGLAAAAELARNGCAVTVIEKENDPGGLLRYAVGAYRLPREALMRDIDYIKSLGVTIETGRAIDGDDDLDALQREYDAVLIATGTWRDRSLAVPGEELEGVEGCLSFLNNLYRNGNISVTGHAAVIGDGNSAFDLARTLRRLGAGVTLLSWFPRDMIPAGAEEVAAALEEGVEIMGSVQVTGFTGENGRFGAVNCIATVPGPPDDNGIPWPVRDESRDPYTLPFDRAFVAIGQVAGSRGAFSGATVRRDEKGGIAADGNSLTSRPGVYAAGDAVNGPTSVVEAMSSGRNAAMDLLKRLGPARAEETPLLRPEERDFDPIDGRVPRQARQAAMVLGPADRSGTFAEVHNVFTVSQAVQEASRCLQCGVCSQCLQCVQACGTINAINMADEGEETIENTGIVILADPDKASSINGDDVIRAYSSKTLRQDPWSMMVRGFAAAARALVLLGSSGSRPKGHGISFSTPDPGLSPEIRIGVFVCRCNDSLGWTDGMESYVRNLTDREDVAHAETVIAACVPDGHQHILRTIREKGLTRVVLASCACCSLNFVCSSCTDQRSRLKYALFSGTGISRSMVEMVNVRGEALRLIESGPSLADKAFSSLMDSSLRRAGRLKVLPTPARNYNFATAVIGESEAVRTSALTLAETGFEVYFFNDSGESCAAPPLHRNIHGFMNADVRSVSGTLGNFQVYYMTDGALHSVQAGTVVLGKKASGKIPYMHQEELPGRYVTTSIQTAGVSGIPFMYPGGTTVPGLYIADIPGVANSDREKGAATAVLAAAKMPRGPRSNRGFTVVINQELCRGCGRCVQYCPYQAISFHRNDAGGWVAAVDDALCKGCGNCISVCPSNAADSPYRSHYFLEKVIEELLI